MNVERLKRLYRERNLDDFLLKTIDDLFYIHGVKLKQTEGYGKLNPKERLIFKEFVLNFYNTQELIHRNITPLKVYLALEKIYVIDTEEINNLPVKIELIDAKTKKIEGTSEYEKFKGRDSRLHIVEKYLRFEFIKDGVEEWLHVDKEDNWY